MSWYQLGLGSYIDFASMEEDLRIDIDRGSFTLRDFRALLTVYLL